MSYARIINRPDNISATKVRQLRVEGRLNDVPGLLPPVVLDILLSERHLDRLREISNDGFEYR